MMNTVVSFTLFTVGAILLLLRKKEKQGVRDAISVLISTCVLMTRLPGKIVALGAILVTALFYFFPYHSSTFVGTLALASSFDAPEAVLLCGGWVVVVLFVA
jgi:hypothetical protein